MNKRYLGKDLSKVINKTAQSLAAKSFNTLRAGLETEAVALIRQGKSREEVARVMMGKDLLCGFRRPEDICDLD